MLDSTTPQPGRSPISQVGAIVVAAGESRRMRGTDKTFADLLGLPLVAYSLEALHLSPQVDTIVLVLGQHNVKLGEELIGKGQWPKVSQICPGGPRRQDSVKEGLQHLLDSEWVLVHDGARPCLEEDLIRRGMLAAQDTGAAVAAVPARDTVKVGDEHGFVVATPPREELWYVQTPQIFRRELLLEAHQKVQDTVTDDATMVEMMGYRVKLFLGSYENIKVTTPEDLLVAESLLQARRKKTAYR